MGAAEGLQLALNGHAGSHAEGRPDVSSRSRVVSWGPQAEIAAGTSE
jgi:hypothetical protein